MKRIAINGFGRIGRTFLRALLRRKSELEVVAINDMADAEILAYAFKYDSVHGRWNAPFAIEKEHFIIDGKRIAVLKEPDPARLPWKEWEIESVIESSGKFRSREGASRHLQAGARKVLITAPSADLTLVMGVNEERYDPQRHHIVSNASCTTHCLAPVAKVLHENFGIQSGLITAIHAYTASQSLVDQPKKKKRMGRAAALSMIPTTTGAAAAIGLVLPELAGRLNGMAVRVPTAAGSILDLVAQTEEKVDIARIHEAFRKASQTSRLASILQLSEEELVSADFVGCSYSAVVDAPSTMVMGEHTLKVLAWYDNEAGFSNRLVDAAQLI
jgi:glyceraldehyde 3-phosphate dehydrogenase